MQALMPRSKITSPKQLSFSDACFGRQEDTCFSGHDMSYADADDKCIVGEGVCWPSAHQATTACVQMILCFEAHLRGVQACAKQIQGDSQGCTGTVRCRYAHLLWHSMHVE